ncbi:NAD+ synthase [Novosphingobium sp.]|uniref:NAD+ synthase n=1 Tax=Novosphingobium sp. TaxID=1874826 RepID=UPI003341D4F9
MADRLIITLAQLNQQVGDLAANAAAMRAVRASAGDSDLIVFPEMQLIGYPPEDLILKPALIARAAQELELLALDTADGGPAMLVGSVFVRDGALHNGVALLDGGRIAAVRFKYELPNYGTFDEKRYFLPGPLPEPVLFKGVMLGLPICEDIWHPDVCRHLAQLGAEILICVNGSPYEIDKNELRIDGVAKRRSADTGVPLVFVNRVGGQDEVVFDGASFVVGPEGALWVQAPDWEEAVIRTEWSRVRVGNGHRWRCTAGPVADLTEHPEDIYCAMVMALRDYVEKNRFPGVVLGLSGGIDSAITAAIAVDALGAERVWCVMLPSQYTSAESLEDAAGCAAMLGTRLDTIPIEPAVAGYTDMLAPVFDGRAPDLTEENLQSRIRGTTLMALSNKFGPMLITTGNKSEMSVGYATIYGDMNGGYNPLKDAYKTTVFAISSWRNDKCPKIGLGPQGPVMPTRVITKPPSAELRPDQKDSDSLPDYAVLDAILNDLIEQERSVDQIVAEGFDRATVQRIEHLVHLAEYKRRQAPPGVKLGVRNFGRDRRYPITHGFRTA